MLPLAVGGMVLFSYLFVSNLEAATQPDTGSTTTTTVAGNGGGTSTTSSTSTTTTTTLPPALAQYQAQVTNARATVAEFLERANRINSDWDNRATSGVDFSTTRSAMQGLQGDVQGFVAEFSSVAAPTDLVPGLTDPHQRLQSRAVNLDAQAAAMIVGLESSDSGERRQLALTRFQESAVAFDAQSEIALGLIS